MPVSLRKHAIRFKDKLSIIFMFILFANFPRRILFLIFGLYSHIALKSWAAEGAVLYCTDGGMSQMISTSANQGGENLKDRFWVWSFYFSEVESFKLVSKDFAKLLQFVNNWQ